MRSFFLAMVGLVCEAVLASRMVRCISAVGVAERVAQERAESIGESVGYQIRLERKMGPRTRLLFMTTGILLRRLHGDPMLEGVTHVLVDEVHERSLDSDFLLIILKELMINRPDIKIVLMSATLNAELFSGYFTTPAGEPSPAIHIPGFTHPVQEHYLEDILRLSGLRIARGSQYAKSKGHGRYDHSHVQNQRFNSRADASRSTGGVAVARVDGALLGCTSPTGFGGALYGVIASVSDCGTESFGVDQGGSSSSQKTKQRYVAAGSDVSSAAADPGRSNCSLAAASNLKIV